MIEKIYSTNIYKTKFTGDTVALKELVLPKLEKLFKVSITGEYHGPVINGICTFFNDDKSGQNLQDWPEFQEFLDFLKQHIKVYALALGLPDYNLEMNGMWANRYPTGSYARLHTHTDDRTLPLYGILFYLQVPENSGNLFLQIPNNEDVLEDHEIELSEGTVVIVPLYLPHYTKPNENKEDKLIIGLEIFLRPVE